MESNLYEYKRQYSDGAGYLVLVDNITENICKYVLGDYDTSFSKLKLS